MSYKLALTRPGGIKALLLGFQMLTDNLLQWIIITVYVAAYSVILGWVAITLPRRVHTLCQDTLFQDREPRRRKRMATTLTVCLIIMVISIGIWGFTRIWNHLTAILL
jgi:hypothetical protein